MSKTTELKQKSTRRIALFAMLAFIFGAYNFYKAGAGFLSRKHLLSSIFTRTENKAQDTGAEGTKIHRKIARIDSAADIGSTANLHEIKINYKKRGGGNGFISISLWAKCDSLETAIFVEEKYPKFQSAIIEKIQLIEEAKITTEEGKKVIQNEMRLAMNAILPRGKVEKIFFHNMIME